MFPTDTGPTRQKPGARRRGGEVVTVDPQTGHHRRSLTPENFRRELRLRASSLAVLVGGLAGGGVARAAAEYWPSYLAQGSLGAITAVGGMIAVGNMLPGHREAQANLANVDPVPKRPKGAKMRLERLAALTLFSAVAATAGANIVYPQGDRTVASAQGNEAAVPAQANAAPSVRAKATRWQLANGVTCAPPDQMISVRVGADDKGLSGYSTLMAIASGTDNPAWTRVTPETLTATYAAISEAGSDIPDPTNNNVPPGTTFEAPVDCVFSKESLLPTK